MNARILSAPLLALLCACGSTTTSTTTDWNEAEMNAKWMAFMTPGPQHKVLDAKVGTWDTNVTMFNPDGSKVTTRGTSEISWVMDGRYLQERASGDFQGMTFQGLGTTAYDNIKKCYVASWIDNMGTGIMIGDGMYDASRKTFTFKTEMPDVMEGRYSQGRSVETMQDANHWKVEMWAPGPDGKEMKMMEIGYTRKAG